MLVEAKISSNRGLSHSKNSRIQLRRTGFFSNREINNIFDRKILRGSKQKSSGFQTRALKEVGAEGQEDDSVSESVLQSMSGCHSLPGLAHTRQVGDHDQAQIPPMQELKPGCHFVLLSMFLTT
jgi:hypothetical protein